MDQKKSNTFIDKIHWWIYMYKYTQRQSPGVVPRKRCSETMQEIYRRTHMPKCDFNKVALLCNFVEIALRHGCFPVNLLHIFRTPFPKNFSRRLLLNTLREDVCTNKYASNTLYLENKSRKIFKYMKIK